MTSLTAPLVSILTPSMNQGRWLRYNIASVAAQTYPLIEHVIADGGSTDGSLEILRTSRDVRWVSEDDRGQSHALNKAFAASTGEIIGWLNSDDAYFDRDAVMSAVEVFRDRPDVDVLYGHAALVNPGNRLLHLIWAPRFNRRLFHLFNFIIQPTVFIRRAVLEEGFVDESFESMMDRELWLRLAKFANFRRLDRIVAIDRHYPERKALARRDLAHADDARLRQMYQLPSGAGTVVLRKFVKIGGRVLAVRFIPELGLVDVAGTGRDKLPRLLARQLLIPRRLMPLDR